MRKINTDDFQVATRSTSRDINRQIALNLIREHQPISRADLARLMNITRGVVTTLANELIEQSLIYEGATGEASRGRKPTFLHVRTRDRLAIAVDVRFSRTFLMLSDFAGHQIALEIFETIFDHEMFIKDLAERVRRLIKNHNAADLCEGLGLVVPGISRILLLCRDNLGRNLSNLSTNYLHEGESVMKQMKHMPKTSALLFVMLIAFVSALYGQTSTGSVNGTITDPNGAGLPGATAKLISQATNIESQAVSNQDGFFTFINVKPGLYVLRVEVKGFKRAQTSVFDVGVNQTVTHDVNLAVGDVTETIEVTTGTELAARSSAELGSVIQERAVQDLPLNGRNFTQLLSLTPGATPVNTAQGGGVSFQDAGPSGIPGSAIIKPSLHGQQNRSLLYFMDGFINTDLRGPIYGILPIVDLIQEFKVQAHNDSAEYGGVTGGIVNVVSKSGSNNFHGSVYEFLRNDAFDARNPFTDATRTSPAPYHQNQFGATFGGPIIKDRTFFYGGYEGWRFSRPTQGLSYVPTAAELNGDFTGSPSTNQIFNPYSTRPNPLKAGTFIRDPFMCDGAGNPLAPLANGTQPAGTACNKIPAALISPAMQGLLKAYLLPPNFNGGTSTQNYIENRPQIDNANSWQIRVDHRLTNRDNIFFRFSQILDFHVDTVDGTNETKPSNYHGNNYGGGWIHTFGPNLILDVRAGILQKPYVFNQAQSSVGIDPLNKLGFTNVGTYGGLVVNLASPWTGNDIGNRGDSIRSNPDWSGSANLDWIKGNHSLNMGYQYIYVARDQINTNQVFGYSGTITNNPLSTGGTGLALASALLGFPASSSGELPTGGEVHFRLSTWSLYFEDKWKVKPKLTLNLGLRWDVLPVPVVIGPRLSNALDLFGQQWLIGAAPGQIPACNTSNVNPCFPGNGLSGVPFSDHIQLTGDKSFQPPAIYDNLGPRIGVAWQFRNNTVIRAGYGLYFDALPARSQYAQNDLEAAQWPWVRAFSGAPNSVVGAPLVPITAVAGQLSAGPPSSPWNSLQSTFFDDPNYKDAWSQQYSFEVQRELNNSTLLSVAYVGSVNGRLPYSGKANAAKQPSPQGTPLTTVDALRAIPWMTSNLTYTQSIGSSTYNALQVKLERRFARGLSTLISYTWSKSIDNSSGYFGVENGAGQNGSSVQNYFDLNSNRSVSGYDVPHFFSWFTVYEVPFGKGKRWLKDGPASWALGNWQVNYIFQMRSGQPFNINVGGDPALISGSIGSVTGYARPNLISDPFVAGPVAANPDPKCQTTISQGGRAADAVYSAQSWFNPCAFALPVGTFGNFGRNALKSSSVYNLDMSFFKKFPIGEKKELQFRIEAFNIFNIQNLASPGSGNTTIGNNGAGAITGIVGNPRELQFGLRFIF